MKELGQKILVLIHSISREYKEILLCNCIMFLFSGVRLACFLDGPRKVVICFAQNFVRCSVCVEVLQLVEGRPDYMDDRPHDGKTFLFTPRVVFPAEDDVAVAANPDERPLEPVSRDPVQFQIFPHFPYTVTSHASEIPQELVQGAVQVALRLADGCKGVEGVQVLGLFPTDAVVNATKVLCLGSWASILHRGFGEDSEILVYLWRVGNLFLLEQLAYLASVVGFREWIDHTAMRSASTRNISIPALTVVPDALE